MSTANDTRTKTVILASTIVAIALLHYLTPTESHTYHKLHIVLRKLYFLPPVMAAAWFGLRKACLTALVVSVLFVIHAFVDWPSNYMEQANQVGELAGFWLAAVVPGWLFDRQRTLLRQLAQANEETILGLVSALDLRERHTHYHSQRVRNYTELLATRHGLDQSTIREIGLGALLHDVGKIAVPDQILLKESRLSEAEWVEMRKHPEAGYRILKKIAFLKGAAEMVYSHHERYDGSGYPRGQKGDEIPLGARLFMVADVYDALTSQRPYKPPLSHEEAVQMIGEETNSHFDPAVVQTFMAIAPGDFRSIAERYRDTDSATPLQPAA
ncbi:HD domain-containing protein [Geomonas sp. Red32]|uniref:HD-GYP domain-containing protein n=1 Tax=Geomonas sp. Red32 TaxID=2912856 RepID=UPI00202CF317|nr:HD domain-containing phosphohydrolase [Geomonas sp. Red32]MCM0083582.1 HD domain-containing protein [Geomonas sp. Red32]